MNGSDNAIISGDINIIANHIQNAISFLLSLLFIGISNVCGSYIKEYFLLGVCAADIAVVYVISPFPFCFVDCLLDFSST